MRELTKDEMKAYVEAKLPTTQVISAKKVGNILAIPGTVGEQVVTWPKDGDEPERTGVVEIDPNTGQPGWIVTKVDGNNRPAVDKNGHVNQWIIVDSKFQEMYEPSQDGPDLYSKSQIELFIKLDEDLHFGTKYGDMTVMAGGYAKITNMDSISGISEGDFADTYVIVEPQKVEEASTGMRI